MFPNPDTIFTDYLDAGFSPIPVRDDGSKSPAIPAWRSYQQAPADRVTAEGWNTAHRGVGILGGAVSGNLEIIDIDEPSLVRAFHDAVKSQDPSLPERLSWVKTPRRNESGKSGMHLLYRLTELPQGNRKLALSEPEPEIGDDGEPIINPTTGQQNMRPRTLIETRGTGGYVVGVGSAAECHPTKNRYEHSYGRELTNLAVLTPDEHKTLMATAATFDRSCAETLVEPKIDGYSSSDCRPGDLYAVAVSWADILEPQGWQLAHESGGIRYWRRPGKSNGWSATTGLLSKAGNELLCVFSSNAHPFEGPQAGRACTPYSKFSAYALLNHSGDFRVAAKALSDQGYGDAPAQRQREQRLPVKTMFRCEQKLFDQLESGKPLTMPLGIRDIDDAIGGVEPGEMVVLGARPSHGKSLVALQIARSYVERGEHVLMLSEEMNGVQLATRMVTNRTALEANDWSDHVGALRDDSKEYWNTAGDMFIVERTVRIEKAEEVVSQVVTEYPISLLVVDYAQIMEGFGGTKYEQVSNVSSRLKRLAGEHNLVALVLAQLNRDASGRRPVMKDLKESGQIEQDADVVLMLYWPHKDDKSDEDPHKYHILVEKNRNRGTNTHDIVMDFHPESQEIKSRKPANYSDVLGNWNDH